MIHGEKDQHTGNKEENRGLTKREGEMIMEEGDRRRRRENIDYTEGDDRKGAAVIAGEND